MMFRAIRVKLYIARMKEMGFPPDSVVAGSEVNLSTLDDPDCMIDVWQVQRVITNMLSLTGNDAIGFEFGKHIYNSDLGIVGYALMSCRTLSTAVDIWLKYSHPLVGMLVTPSAAKSNEGWSLTFSEITPMGKFFQFCVEENLAIGIKRIRDLIGAPLVLSSLELSYPKPAHYKLYFKEFNCPITFGAAVTRLSVRSPSMNAPIKSYDSEHFQACLTHCEQLLRNISDNQPVASKIRNYLIRKPGMIPSVNEMAAILNFSPRKLSRILKNEHVTYLRLVNDYRRQLTEEYIRTSGLNNKEIAYLLGYEETKAFLAAFKSWTGLNMSDYRKSLTA